MQVVSTRVIEYCKPTLTLEYSVSPEINYLQTGTNPKLLGHLSQRA